MELVEVVVLWLVDCDDFEMKIGLVEECGVGVWYLCVLMVCVVVFGV